MITIAHARRATSGRLRPESTADRGRSAVCVMPAATESVPALRHFARGTARRWELPEAVDEALSLVVTELVANVVRHSGSPDVALLLAVDQVAMTVQVKDTGRWRPRIAPTGASEGGEACGGRGLQLVEAYAPGCAVWRTAGGTRVVAELLLPELPPVRLSEFRLSPSALGNPA